MRHFLKNPIFDQMMNWIILSIWGLSAFLGPQEQQQTLPTAGVPAVFRLTHSDSFSNALTSAHPATLLRTFDNSTQDAFLFWRSFSRLVQASVQEDQIDGQCSQVWIKAYWDKSGKLVHICYDAEINREQNLALNKLFNHMIAESKASGTWPNGFYHFGCIKLP